jgi:hypothetical protein
MLRSWKVTSRECFRVYFTSAELCFRGRNSSAILISNSPLLIGGFHAVDYFEDGSLYILDVPGVSTLVGPHLTRLLNLSSSTVQATLRLWLASHQHPLFSSLVIHSTPALKCVRLLTFTPIFLFLRPSSNQVVRRLPENISGHRMTRLIYPTAPLHSSLSLQVQIHFTLIPLHRGLVSLILESLIAIPMCWCLLHTMER